MLINTYLFSKFPGGAKLRRNLLTMIAKGGEISFSMKFENFSGDWAAATFPPDGQYIILGCPYDFDFVVLERAAA